MHSFLLYLAGKSEAITFKADTLKDAGPVVTLSRNGKVVFFVRKEALVALDVSQIATGEINISIEGEKGYDLNTTP